MKKVVLLLAFFIFATAASAMVRAGVNVGPDAPGGVYYYDDGYYADYWYGPGWYYGVYFNDYPAYYSWRRNYWGGGGPYYWRYRHHHGKHHKQHH